jgi:methyl-accepting chemotaxis protein
MSKLGFKFLKIFTLVAGIAVVILFSTYFFVFNRVQNSLKLKVKTAAVEAVDIIDASKLQTVINQNSEHISEFSDILNSMLLYKAKTDVKNLYTYIKKDEKTALFVVDASPEPADFGEEYEMVEEMLKAFNGQVAVDNTPYTDQWGTFISAYAPIKDSSGQVIAIVGADADVALFQDIKKMFFWSLVFASAGFVVLSITAVFLFSKKLQNNISKIQDNLKLMGSGDLTQAINLKSKDEIEEIANSVNDFRIKIVNILTSITATSDEVLSSTVLMTQTSSEMAASSQNVAAVVQDVSSNSSSQASGLINIDNSMKSFGARLSHIVSSIEEVTDNIKNTAINSKTSNKDLKLLLKSIDDISSGFRDVTSRVTSLSVKLEQINGITNLINNIANQTNLLALNAAIEAARAGEAGRGFAVVADEIRKLAEQSKVSSENINKLLQSILEESSTAITTSDEVNNQLVNQLDTIKKATNSFKTIALSIEAVLPKINSVSELALHLNSEKTSIIKNLDISSSFAEEISASSEEIASLSEELSASTGEVALTADKLSKIMSEMSHSIKQFKI